MRVLYFGTYDRAYPRNAQAISCLRGAGVEVVEENRAVWEQPADWSAGLPQLLRIARAEVSLARTRDPGAEVVVVGYPGHFDLLAARRVARGRPVVFNPLVSLHDTLVGDRRRFRPGSPAAAALARVDRVAFRLPDLVVADTAATADFYRRTFGLPDERVEVCFVGAEDALFLPAARSRQPFHALFVGKLIPLHGLDVILEAARRAPDVPFRVVGSGQLEGLLETRPGNVTWVPWIEYADLPESYRQAGCALGIFAHSGKAARVIPNKVFHALACGCPVVTGDTPAARELLRDGVDALLVPPGDPAALAQAVARLAADASLRARLGGEGRATYTDRASEPVLGRRWLDVLRRAARTR